MRLNTHILFIYFDGIRYGPFMHWTPPFKYTYQIKFEKFSKHILLGYIFMCVHEYSVIQCTSPLPSLEFQLMLTLVIIYAHVWEKIANSTQLEKMF